MPDAFDDIDLSEFGLDGPGDGQTVSTAAPEISDDGISGNVLAELGLGDLEEPAAAVNGQHTFDAPFLQAANEQVEALQQQRIESQALSELEQLQTPHSYTTPPSTGFGILEQILLEISRLSLEIAGLRQTLSNPGALGPSALPQGTQRTPSAPAAEGDVSLTADAPPVRRRRGRPKKEEEQIELDM